MSLFFPLTYAFSRQWSKLLISRTSNAAGEYRSDGILDSHHVQDFFYTAVQLHSPSQSILPSTAFKSVLVQPKRQATPNRKSKPCKHLPVHQSRRLHTNMCYLREPARPRREFARISSTAPSTDSSIKREDLKGLLDYYLQPVHPAPSQLPNSQSLVTTIDSTPLSQPSQPSMLTEESSKTDQEVVERLKFLLHDPHSPNEVIQATYEHLSPPRPLHLSDATRHDLLHRFSDVERKPGEMLRYLTLVSEFKDAHIPLNIYEWTTATFYTARYLHVVSDLSVERAFLVWREMESQAGIRSSEATMTVLFNLAMKARKFVLAEMILEEVDRRSLRKGLHFRASLIFYRGLRGDSQGIRTAYQELVDAGEIVSTAVISCVISALLMCGEPVAAEHVFERAKLLHERSLGRPLPQSHWKHRRNLGKVLQRAANTLRNDEQARREYQTKVAIAPGAQAYKALIRYHSVVVGDLDRTLELINEMHTHGIPVDGSVFVSLFRAFEIHGGIIYTSWTKERLEEVWTTFQMAQDRNREDYYVSKTSAIHVLKAFAKSTGIARAREIWAQIMNRWSPSEPEKIEIERILEKLVNNMHLSYVYDDNIEDDDFAKEYEFGSISS